MQPFLKQWIKARKIRILIEGKGGIQYLLCERPTFFILSTVMSESKIMFLLKWSFYCHLCSSTITCLLSSAHNCQRWYRSCPIWLLWCRTPIPHSCPSPAECGLHSRYPKTQIPSPSYPGGWFWLPCEQKHCHTDIYKNETLFPLFFFL